MAIFVGRSTELECLEAAFARAHRGFLQVVTIEGDAGIGKTRLLEELAKRILPTAPAFCVGHCLEYIRAPYLPFAEVFRGLGVSPPEAQPSAVSGCDGDAKFRYFTAVAATLIERSEERTVVVAIEDAHWADDATLELVQYLALRLRESRVLLVLTQRSDSPQSASAFGSLLVRLLRLGAKHVRLQPLSHEDATELLFSLTSNAAMSPDIASLIEATADGNPFFLEELVRTARDHAGAGQPAALQIPLTIKAMLSERLLTLTDRERDVLTHAAVVGRHFDVEFLCDISGHSREDVRLSLQRARDLQLIVPDAERSSHYSFRHALLRETLYQALPVDDARPLHSRVAERIEAGPQTTDVFAELAYHWNAAGIEGKAVEANERAGDAAIEMFAYSDAVRFYHRAAAHYPAGPCRARLYERMALALRSAGGNEETRLWFERAYEDHRQLGDSESMVRVLLLLAFQDWLDCNTEGSVRRTTQALRLLEDREQPQLLVNARLAKAAYCSTLGRVEEARQLLDSVAAMEFSRDDETNALFHEILAETEIALDFGAEALVSVAAAATHAQRTGSADTISRVENMAVITCSLLARFEAAETHFDRAIAAAQENGLLWRAAHACVHYADTLVLAGRLESARDVLERGLSSVITSRTIRACAAFTGIPLASMLADRALLERVADEKLLEDAFRSAEPQRIGPIAAAFAEMYAADGEFGRARALLRSAIRRSRRFHFSWRLALQAALLCEAEDRAEIEAFLETAPQAREPMSLAFAELVSASLKSRSGFPSECVASARSAARRFAELRCPNYEARALEFAQEPYSALALYERVGNVRDTRRMQRELRLETRVVTSPLTARQREVAAILVKGASNREIAGRLSITVNTVEHHVSEILSRLGVSSRAKLAARLLNPAGDVQHRAG